MFAFKAIASRLLVLAVLGLRGFVETRTVAVADGQRDMGALV